MKKSRKRTFYIISIIAALAVFAGVYNYILGTFADTGAAKEVVVSSAIQQSENFVEILAKYSDQYLKFCDPNKESELFDQIKYDPESDSIRLTGPYVGTLTGNGAIPESGLARTEMNMTLSYLDFFSEFYSKLPGATWIYYTSENDYVYLYPQVPEEFVYTDELKSVAFYTVAMPENDPSRAAVWSPVYLDEVGKGFMVTLSSPIYYEDDFWGVLSLDLTTETLGELMVGKYDAFLIDQSGSVIAAGQELDFSKGVEGLGSLLGVPENSVQNVQEIASGTVERIGTRYYYKYDFSAAPWTLIVTAPTTEVAGKAAVFSLPVFIIGILLFFAIGEAESRRSAAVKATNMAITDQLTGLNNRFYLDAIIEKYFQSSDRYDEALSVATFDLDHFKNVNDKWGHDTGDEVLKMTADTAKRLLRDSDHIVRLGGEEFLILLPRTDSKGAFEVSEKIRMALAETAHPVAGVTTASFGIAERVKGEAYSNLYRRADEALYMAKEGGRNCIYSFDAIEERPANSVIVKWSENWTWLCGNWRNTLSAKSEL
ncbi:MAG: sensor domain-containing diguanylate cyclase [Clostridia bacterium]|nr:sensor domain-containing diguanylate cyclase [Clostridia bacterium]